MLAGLCGAAMQQLRYGCAPSCPHVWMTVGPMASASCCAPTTTCMRPASARLVSGLGWGADQTGGFLGIRVAIKGTLRNWVWAWGEHNCLLNPRVPSLLLPAYRVAGLGLYRQRRCAHLRIPAAVHTPPLPEQPHVLATCSLGHSEPICTGSRCLRLHHVLLHGMQGTSVSCGVCLLPQDGERVYISIIQSFPPPP